MNRPISRATAILLRAAATAHSTWARVVGLRAISVVYSAHRVRPTAYRYNNVRSHLGYFCVRSLDSRADGEQWWDAAIMMSRTRITLENEMQRRASSVYL
jgi:hypothetical protein